MVQHPLENPSKIRYTKYSQMQIFVAADHRGFKLKQQILDYLKTKGHQIQDCGNTKLDPNDDYPDFVHDLYLRMTASLDSGARGIVICGSGVGVDIAANRYPELRCGLCATEKQAKDARKHDDINVLAIAADYNNIEKAKKIVDGFLNTNFDNHPRHLRRLQKINNYAQSGSCSNCTC